MRTGEGKRGRERDSEREQRVYTLGCTRTGPCRFLSQVEIQTGSAPMGIIPRENLTVRPRRVAVINANCESAIPPPDYCHPPSRSPVTDVPPINQSDPLSLSLYLSIFLSLSLCLCACPPGIVGGRVSSLSYHRSTLLALCVTPYSLHERVFHVRYLWLVRHVPETTGILIPTHSIADRTL